MSQGVRKIPTVQGGSQNLATISKGKPLYYVAVKAGFYHKAVEECYILTGLDK